MTTITPSTARSRVWTSRLLGILGSALGFGAAAFVYWSIQPVATMLAPAIISAFPLVGAIVGRFRAFTLAAAVLMGAFAFLGGFSVGILFVPSAALFAIAATVSGESVANAV